jgi:hypothetical protein
MLRAFEQGGIFIVPYLLQHGTSVLLVSPKGLPHLLVASYNTQRDVEDLLSQVTHYDGDHTFKYGKSHSLRSKITIQYYPCK